MRLMLPRLGELSAKLTEGGSPTGEDCRSEAAYGGPLRRAARATSPMGEDLFGL